MSLSHIKQAGYTDDDVEKRRVPHQVKHITNGFVYEAIKFFESNVSFVDFMFRVTGNPEFKDCNQKSLKKKMYDMVALAKKRRRSKDTKFQVYLAQEFKPPVRSSDIGEKLTRSALLKENEALKKKIEEMESDYEELKAKYDDAIRKLKRLEH